ncbi:hypothetical protein FHG87_013666 [Trinorchestia longiramus]|nr:hypothetical protein FHG87_013666 [Trinorchestia longiramus]
MTIWSSFWKLSTTSTNGISAATSRSLGSLWTCKRSSQSTVTFSIDGTLQDWGSRSTLVPDEHRVEENLLVDMNKVFIPSLYIKLDLMKIVEKAMDKNGAAFQHLCTLFPALSSVKLKESIFVRRQILEVLRGTR